MFFTQTKYVTKFVKSVHAKAVAPIGFSGTKIGVPVLARKIHAYSVWHPADSHSKRVLARNDGGPRFGFARNTVFVKNVNAGVGSSGRIFRIARCPPVCEMHPWEARVEVAATVLMMLPNPNHAASS
jgi:hypothetical protein